MAVWAESTTHSGILKLLISPPANSTLVMMPIVFWASLPPCPSEKAAAEKSCSTRDHLSTAEGVCLVLKMAHEAMIFRK